MVGESPLDRAGQGPGLLLSRQMAYYQVTEVGSEEGVMKTGPCIMQKDMSSMVEGSSGFR